MSVGTLEFSAPLTGSGVLAFGSAGATVRAIVLREGALTQAHDGEVNMYPPVRIPGRSPYLVLDAGVLREAAAGETVIV